MNIKTFTLFISLFVSTKAFAGWIYADDFALGTQLGEIDGVSFSMEKKLQYQQPQANSVTIEKSRNSGPQNFYPHNHFGYGSSVDNLYHHEAFNAPIDLLGGYNALNIAFNSQPITSFSFKAEWSSGSPIGLLAYDESGTFRKGIIFSGWDTLSSDFVIDEEYSADFDFNVGSIKLGSMSDVAYIYAINATVPEPSSALLFLIGLSILAFKQKHQTTKLLKLK